MDQEKIGKLIAKLRKEKKLTQEQLGAKLGVNGKAVSKWECGLTTPDISIVNELASILGISTNELLEGKQKINKDTKKGVGNKIKTFISKNIIFIIVIFLLCIICTLFSSFFVNNYKKYQLISFKSNNSEFYVEGYIAIYPNKELIILNDLVYQSKEKGTSNEIKVEQLKINIINGNETIFEYVFEKQYNDDGEIKKNYISDVLENFLTITTEDKNNTAFKNKGLKLLIEYQLSEEIIVEEYELDVTVDEISSTIIK